MLRSDSLHPRVLLRYGITGNILDQSGVKHEIVDAIGKSKLAQMMSLIFMGDYVSYYLALLYGIDPYPIKAVAYLKAELDINSRGDSMGSSNRLVLVSRCIKRSVHRYRCKRHQQR